MKQVESDHVRKEKLLQRLRSLSPTARKAILLAALELKEKRSQQSLIELDAEKADTYSDSTNERI